MTTSITTRTCTNCKDRWNWVAVYKDGARLYECNGSNALDHHVYADIELDRVETLGWLPVNGELPAVFLPSRPGELARPVLFRRRLIELQVYETVTTPRVTIHGLGWESDIENKYMFLMSDGSVIHSTNKNAV
jgi:hypothetical protein